MVVLGQKWLYSDKVVVFGQEWLFSGKLVIFGKRWWYLLKSGCIREI